MGIVDLIGITAIVALFAISAGFLFVLFAVAAGLEYMVPRDGEEGERDGD